LTLPAPTAEVLSRLKQKGILGGLDLQGYYPELGNALLICTTETKTAADLQNYAEALEWALS
jgi:glycine dehydrogenase subunit 1